MSAAVVVTMAGESRRFREAGYAVPKYRLRVRGRTLFAWAIESLRGYLDEGARLILVCLADDASVTEFVTAECHAMGFAAPTVELLDAPTAGQAETVLAAAPHVAPGQQLIIYNIDTHVRPEAFGPDTLAGDGCIPCFPGAGDAWSFVAAGSDGRVTAVAEKRRISPHASVGLYVFRDLALYREAYDDTQRVAVAGGRSERFVAPMYAALLDAGRDIRMTALTKHDVIPLGTPAEAERFGPIEL
jgi:hypothetical protein